MSLHMSENCKFVEGYKNAAIYDFNNGKVYSINTYGKNLIKESLNGKNINLSKKKITYITELTSLKLISTEKKLETNIIKETPTLNYAWLELTEMCNLNCIHCYGQFGCPNINQENVLTDKDWKNIIDKLIKIGCKEIQLIGGEPMAYKNFFEILKYAHEKGMQRIDVFTNGTYINENNIKWLKINNANVRVSIYGHDKELHDKITKQKDSFIKSKKALQLLKKYEINTTIAVVIMKENEKYLQEIKDYIKSLGHIYNGYDVIRPSCITDNKEHSISNLKILENRYSTKPEFWTSQSSFNRNHFYNSCWNGKIAITSTGDIIPCIFARDDIVGNIKKDSMKSITDNILKKWCITKDDIDVCKDCEYRYCCHDCRPLARGINGNINSKYPRCCYNPYKRKMEKDQGLC